MFYRWWQSSVLIVLGLGIGLLLVEFLLRLVPSVVPFELHPWIAKKPGLLAAPQAPQFLEAYRGLWEKDKVLQGHMKPHVDTILFGHPEYPVWHLQTDSLALGSVGFRDTLPSRAPYAIVIGDSFGFGIGVRREDLWMERLERETGSPFVNLSQIGASSLQEALIYAEYGRHLPATVVFWMFYQNDLKENIHFVRWQNPALSIPPPIAQPSHTCRGRLHQFLRRYSIAYEPFLYWRRACEYSAIPYRPSYQNDHLALTFCYDSDICNFGLQERMIREGWPLTRAALSDTLTRVARAGATLVILIVPSKEQVYWEQFQQVASFPADYHIDQLVEPLRAFCAQKQLYCLDLTEAFRTHAGAGEQLYFPVDIHWNAQGHALVAQVVRDYLHETGLLER